MTQIFVTAHRVSQMFQLHHDTTKKYLKALNVPTYRIGKRTYYLASEVSEAIKQSGDLL